MALLRILSINLLVDRVDLSDLRLVITEADPDVVCTQEMGHATAAAAAKLLPSCQHLNRLVFLESGHQIHALCLKYRHMPIPMKTMIAMSAG